MVRKTQKTQKWIVLTLVGVILLITSCKKDKVPDPIPLPGPTKWELIAGTYKVYDSTGTEYLYQMEITHSYNSNGNQDSLHFISFDGEFNISAVQSNSNQDPEYLIIYGYHPLVYDTNGKRWKLIYSVDQEFDNILQDDTIKMSFTKTNINYYIEDLTPYYACDCKQIAVKQH